nr:ribonuclease H-like domain-containing protein [Tanacetum cinerariifolium]
MADFHHLDDAREIWLAVKARFGGKEESKKIRKTMLKQEFSEFSVSEEEGLHKGYDKFQKILSQLNQMQAKPDNDDVNMKFLRALPPSWSQNEYEAENKTEEGEQVYGLMARFKLDFADHVGNAAGSVYDAAAEFAMMGISPKEWEVKLEESLARFDKWKESSKNLAKLINSSMSTRTKLGLRFKESIGSDEVFYLSTPSVFDPEPENREVKSLYESYKSSESETYDFASCVSSPKTNDTFSTVDVKILPKSDVKDPSPTNGFPSCSFKENVKPPRNLSSVPAGSSNSSASISAGRSIPAASKNRPASIHAGRHIHAGRFNKPTPFPAGRSVPVGWTNHAAIPFFRPTNLYFDNVSWPRIYDQISMNEGRWVLLLSPQQISLSGSPHWDARSLELASPEQTATGKDISNPFIAVMVCQKPLGYFSSPMIHVLRARLVIHPPG